MSRFQNYNPRIYDSFKMKARQQPPNIEFIEDSGDENDQDLQIQNKMVEKKPMKKVKLNQNENYYETNQRLKESQSMSRGNNSSRGNSSNPRSIGVQSKISDFFVRKNVQKVNSSLSRSLGVKPIISDIFIRKNIQELENQELENGEIVNNKEVFFREEQQEPKQLVLQSKDDGREEFQLKRLKIEEFMQEMVENPYVSMSLRDVQDRKVLAEYMYEKKFPSFHDYQFRCSELGRSLLTEPYALFGIQRQFQQKKNSKEHEVLRDKQRLLQLHEDLEPQALRFTQKRLYNKEYERKRLIRVYQESRKQNKDNGLQELEKKYIQMERDQKRQAAINFYSHELKSQLNLDKGVKLEYQHKEQPQQKAIVVDQSRLQVPFKIENLKDYKQKVFAMIQKVYKETRSNIMEEIERKRRESKDTAIKMREARVQNKRAKQATQQQNQQDFSSDSIDSILITQFNNLSHDDQQKEQQSNQSPDQSDNKSQSSDDTSRSFWSSSNDSIQQIKHRLKRNDVDDDDENDNNLDNDNNGNGFNQDNYDGNHVDQDNGDQNI